MRSLVYALYQCSECRSVLKTTHTKLIQKNDVTCAWKGERKEGTEGRGEVRREGRRRMELETKFFRYFKKYESVY